MRTTTKNNIEETKNMTSTYNKSKKNDEKKTFTMGCHLDDWQY